jgi:hypothetical protein
MSQAQSSTVAFAAEDDWTVVTDADEWRKIQNRIAQRKFSETPEGMKTRGKATDIATGEKVRQRREESKRKEEIEMRAAGAYHAPEADEVDNAAEPGLPWGSISLRYAVRSGRVRQEEGLPRSISASGDARDAAWSPSRLVHGCRDHSMQGDGSSGPSS